MAEKNSAGWLVEVPIPAATVNTDEAVGAVKTPPAFRFFNVAIKSRQEAEEAVKSKMIVSDFARIRGVRALFQDEIDKLGLKPGRVKPA